MSFEPNDERQAVRCAREAAARRRDAAVGTEHLLLGIAGTESCRGAQLLRKLGVDLEAVSGALPPSPSPAPFPSAAPAPEQVPFTPHARQAFEAALACHAAATAGPLDTVHLLLGILEVPGCEGARALATLGVDRERGREAAAELRSDLP